MNTALKKPRVPSIDRFRGAVVFCMIFFQFAEHFKNLGSFAAISHHAPSEDAFYILPNLAIADIVAPMFILAIGLTYLPSLQRRIEKNGKKEAYLHFVNRYAGLIGIGCILDGVNDILEGKFSGLPLVFAVMAAVVLLVIIIFGITKLFKAKKLSKLLGRLLGIIVVAIGFFGVGVALVNAALLVTGKTADSFGHWVVLQHIGFAGLVSIPFAAIKGRHATAIRFICAVLILGAYAVFHELSLSGTAFVNNRELIDKVADGGFIGGFAWAAMLIIYLAFSELYYKSRKNYAIGLSVFGVVAAGLTVGVFVTLPDGAPWAGAVEAFLPINKGSVSPSFVVISAFIALLAFFVFDLFNKFTPAFDPLAWWGKNPILLYCLEFAFVGGLNAAFGDFFEAAPIPAALAIIAAVIAALTALVYGLNKKNIIIKL